MVILSAAQPPGFKYPGSSVDAQGDKIAGGVERPRKKDAGTKEKLKDYQGLFLCDKKSYLYYKFVDYNYNEAYGKFTVQGKPNARWGRKATGPLKRRTGLPDRRSGFFFVLTAD